MAGRITANMIEVRQGDSFNINIAVSENCKEKDLTGFVCKMQVKQKGGAIMFEVTDTPVDAEHGKVMLQITPGMTSMEVGDYVCDIQIAKDDEVHTIYPADINKVAVFRVTEQITQ